MWVKRSKENKVTGHEIGIVKGLAHKPPGEAVPPVLSLVDVIGHNDFNFVVLSEYRL